MVMTLRDALAREWPGRQKTILTAALASATLGLAPFFPHAHVWKQLVNLANHRLTEPIDVFDLFFHGAPWLWLFYTLGAWLLAGVRRVRA